MDPELIQQYATILARLRSQGASEDQIDTLLREAGKVELGRVSGSHPDRKFFQAVADGGYRGFIEQMRQAPQFKPYKATARDVVRAELQGASLGFGDELAGAIAAAIPGGRGYTETRDRVRRAQHRFHEQTPAGDFIAQAIGALIIPGASATGANQGLSLGARVLRGIRTGAEAGALAGIGYSEHGLDEPLKLALDAIAGGTVGGAFGAFAGVAPIPERVLDTNAQAGRIAAREAVEGAARRGGLESSDIGLRVELGRSARPDLYVGGDIAPELAGLARREARRGTPSLAVSGRQIGQTERIVQDLREGSGFGESIASARQRAKNIREALRRDTYDVWDREFPVFDPETLPPQMADALTHPRVEEIWRGVRSDLNLGPKNPGGFTAYQRLRRRVNEQVQKLRKDGQIDAAEILERDRNAIDLGIDKLVGGGFLRAVEQYKRSSAVIDAFTAGAKAVRSNMTPSEITTDMQRFAQRADDLSEEALNAYRHGFVDHFASWLEKNPKLSAANRVRSVNTDRLRIMFPDNESLQAFLTKSEVEANMELLTKSMGKEAPRGKTPAGLNTLSKWGLLSKAARMIQEPRPAAQAAYHETLNRLLLDPRGLTEILNNPELRKTLLGPTLAPIAPRTAIAGGGGALLGGNAVSNFGFNQ